MKIGIVTFWQTRDNYGQMLQCWALQRKLISWGHDPFLIRYTHSEVVLYRFNFKKALSDILHRRWKSLLPPRKKYLPLPQPSKTELMRNMEAFKVSYIKMSERIYTSLSDLRINPPLADCYIVGSDQVWGQGLHFNENRVFYLDFGPRNIKRISYAASFGLNAYTTGKETLKNALDLFDAVSVRECSGLDICSSVGVLAKLVLDPTLLLTAKDYIDSFGLHRKNSDIIYIYSLNITSPDEMGWSKIKKYAEKQKLVIKVTPGGGYISSCELFGPVNYEYSTIEHWLENILSSRLVITTSFHGIVFCILFHTPFIYVPLSGRFSQGNDRILSLLKMLDLEMNIYSNGFDIDNFVMPRWDTVDNKLEDLRKDSLDFLKNAISK